MGNVNQDRRDRLRDAAIHVLAESGARGLTHRAIDATARVPAGTTKNYFPTRDAVLKAIAERCAELYHQLPIHPPTDRKSLIDGLTALMENVAGPGRSRLIAIHELQGEAARKPWLAEIMDGLVAADFADLAHAQRAAGLDATPRRAAAVTLALHAAIPYLLAGGPATLAATGLHDVRQFTTDLLDSVYGRTQPAVMDRVDCGGAAESAGGPQRR